MEVCPSSHGDGDRLMSPADQETSHLPVSQPSPEGRAPTSKPKAGGRCPSGRGFLKRKFPLWLRRKESTNAPQGPVVSHSRLCVEVAHESPIQAVRRPAPQKEALGLNSEGDSGRGKTGSSLLRRLLCLKATNSRLKEEASPLRRPRCGPVTSLSRTADPQGDSPLRWKPRAEALSPPEADGPLAEPEKAEMADRVGASWLEKPWRNFRTMMTTGAKRASFLSGNKRNEGVTGERVLCLPAQPETSPATEAEKSIREPENCVAAVEDQTPSPAPPSEVDEHYGGREGEGSRGTPWQGLEPHRRVEGISKPVPRWPGREEGNPVLEVVYELERSQTKGCDLPGRVKLEAGGMAEEGKGPPREEDGCWLGGSAGEDLADLAENPGGQGMLMATRDLGWLNSEDLGGPVIGRKVKGKTAASKSSDANMRGTEEEDVGLADSPRVSKYSDKPGSGAPLDKAGGGSCIFPTSFMAENAIHSIVMSPPSGTSALEEVGARCPVVLQETSRPTLLEQGPPFSSRELQRGAEGAPTSVPIQTLTLVPPGENSSSQGSPWPLGTKEPSGATPWPGTTGPDEKHLIYVAAVEIVEAAIDAAAEQLAKKRQQERAGPWSQADVTAKSSAGATTRWGGNVDV